MTIPAIVNDEAETVLTVPDKVSQYMEALI